MNLLFHISLFLFLTFIKSESPQVNAVQSLERLSSEAHSGSSGSSGGSMAGQIVAYTFSILIFVTITCCMAVLCPIFNLLVCFGFSYCGFKTGERRGSRNYYIRKKIRYFFFVPALLLLIAWVAAKIPFFGDLIDIGLNITSFFLLGYFSYLRTSGLERWNKPTVLLVFFGFIGRCCVAECFCLCLFLFPLLPLFILGVISYSLITPFIYMLMMLGTGFVCIYLGLKVEDGSLGRDPVLEFLMGLIKRVISLVKGEKGSAARVSSENAMNEGYVNTPERYRVRSGAYRESDSGSGSGDGDEMENEKENEMNEMSGLGQEVEMKEKPLSGSEEESPVEAEEP